MKLVKVEDSYLNIDAVALIAPDAGEAFRGMPVSDPDPGKCTILTTGGHKVVVRMSVEELVRVIGHE